MPDTTIKIVKKNDLVITRIFKAPIALVWQAWTDAQLIMRWWGPNGFTCPSAQLDFRVGGTSLVCMRAPKEFGGQDMYSTWAYTKIVPLQLIEYVHNLADQTGQKVDPVKLGLPADFPQAQRHAITFKDLGNGTTEITITEYHWTIGPMAEMSELGMNQCLDKLAAMFENIVKSLSTHE